MKDKELTMNMSRPEMIIQIAKLVYATAIVVELGVIVYKLAELVSLFR